MHADGSGGRVDQSTGGVALSYVLLSDTRETTPQDVCELWASLAWEEAIGRQTCGRWQQEAKLAGGVGMRRGRIARADVMCADEGSTSEGCSLATADKQTRHSPLQQPRRRAGGRDEGGRKRGEEKRERWTGTRRLGSGDGHDWRSTWSSPSTPARVSIPSTIIIPQLIPAHCNQIQFQFEHHQPPSHLSIVPTVSIPGRVLPTPCAPPPDPAISRRFPDTCAPRLPTAQHTHCERLRAVRRRCCSPRAPPAALAPGVSSPLDSVPAASCENRRTPVLVHPDHGPRALPPPHTNVRCSLRPLGLACQKTHPRCPHPRGRAALGS